LFYCALITKAQGYYPWAFLFMMANLDQYRVNPKSFSSKDFNTNDRSNRTGSKGQDAQEISKPAATNPSSTD